LAFAIKSANSPETGVLTTVWEARMAINLIT
jgi:hypothetical protein